EADRVQTNLANCVQHVNTDEPPRSDFGAARREERGHSEQSRAQPDEQQADREFRRARRLPVAHFQPEPRADRSQNNDGDCRNRLIPPGGELATEYEAVGEVAREEVETRPGLLITRPEDD